VCVSQCVVEMQNVDSIDLSLSSEASSLEYDVIVDDVSQLATAVELMTRTGDDINDSRLTCTTSAHTCVTCTLSPVSVSTVQETSLSHASQTVSRQSESSRCSDSLSSSAGSMVPVSSVSPPHLPDFSSVEIPRWDYPAELREPEYDAVVISTLQDTAIAEMFSYIVSEFITLEVWLFFSPHLFMNAMCNIDMAIPPVLPSVRPSVCHALIFCENS